MPLPPVMPYPAGTPYTVPYPASPYQPQTGSNISQGPNVPQPSAPYDLDVPPNYDDAMTAISKEQKKI